MRVHALRDRPPPQLGKALAEFEARFTYPLGPGRAFRISHGEDYPRFFRAMGPAVCFVAQKEDRVIGALAVAIRPILMPDGSQRQVAYIGDLKVDPDSRGGLALLRLGLAAQSWAKPQVTAAYGVVMDGTPASPASYSGRAGLASFLKVGRVFVLRIATGIDAGAVSDDRWIVPSAQGMECYRSLSSGRYVAWGGTPAERSEMAPVWLMHPDGTACGLLEDTRRAKRLTDNDGVEMLSAHLSCVAWQTASAGAQLIGEARRRAAAHGFPALFLAVAEREMGPLNDALGRVEKIVAPATVYGAALSDGPAWTINTSEI